MREYNLKIQKVKPVDYESQVVRNRRSNWGSLHTHSQFSVLDGMVPVPELVAKAAAMGQSFMGLTDHGNMAGTVQLYKAGKKHGIPVFPGFEAYLLDPKVDDPMDASTKRFHLGLLARNLDGYKALVKYNSLSYTRPRFSRFPRLLLSDLASLGEEAGDGIILLTGCFFGLAQQRLDTDGIATAERVIKTYASWFPHTFVEIQNHNITHHEEKGIGPSNDIEMATELVRIADQLGLPVMATQDSHYLDQRQKAAHALMKRMVYGGVEDEFPGDSFHMASADWMKEHFTPGVWNRVEEASEHVLKLHDLHIPPLDEFKPHVPAMFENADDRLRTMVNKWIDKHCAHMSVAKQKKYHLRSKEELAIISHLGYANYFHLIRKVVKECERRGIFVEARGSANGSLVCYALGITQADPIEWDLLFERFLSRDRIKPPDIDLDIEDTRRGEILAWLAKEFPTVQIGTWSELGASQDNPERGSVLVSYAAYLRRKASEMARVKLGDDATKKAVDEYAGRIFGKRFAHVKSIEDVQQISRLDYDGLRELARMKSVYRSYGVHAAGILLGSDTLDWKEYVPTMLVASSDTTVTQFDMDDVEEMGLLKLDLLGQATLTVMKLAQELIGKDKPTSFKWIHKDDKQACKVLREGRTDNGIFHFEGYTKAKGGREMGIASTKDAVLATALYMPGAMDSGQTALYLKYRRDKSKKPKYLHPIYEAALKDTYGAVIFQEQPLAILRAMGMSIENINVMFKVVKDSGKGAVERNADRMAALRKEFNKLCKKHGIEQTDEAWHLVTGFIAYGFNKSHAAGYGVRAYRCAYLKAHYPLEFMTALLTVWAGRSSSKKKGGPDKEKLYQREARRIGLRLLPPHVNVSGASWTMDRNRKAIRRGLVSITGIGVSSAYEIAGKAPYRSVTDLCTRCSGRAVSGGNAYLKDGTISGKLGALEAVGAIAELPE